MPEKPAERPEAVLFGHDPKALASVEKIDATVKSFDAGASLFMKGAMSSLGDKKSIIGKARENLFEFPVFISDTVSLDNATAVNTLLEQVYASYLQMAISADPLVDAELVKRQGPKLSKYKTNTTRYVETVDLDFQRDSCHAVYDNGDTIIEYSMLSITDAEANTLLEAVNYQPLSEFDHYFTEQRNGNNNGGRRPHYDRRTGLDLSDPTNQEALRQWGDARSIMDMQDSDTAAQKARTRQYEAETSRQEKERHDSMQAARDEVARQSQELRDSWARDDAERKRQVDRAEEEISKVIEADYLERLNGSLEDEIKKGGKTEAQITALRNQIQSNKTTIESLNNSRNGEIRKTMAYKRLQDEYEDFTRKKKDEVYKQKEDARKDSKELRDQAAAIRDTEKHLYDTKTKAPQMLDEGKINKINTMKPLMMLVNLSLVDKYGGVSRPVEIIVGVKTFCRLIDSQTLPEVVEYPMKEMNKITRKAKWRAGELKFFKDILFHIKEKKQTAIDKNDPKRKWYRRLYELAHMKGDAIAAKNVTGRRGEEGLIPNASFVISKSDVDMIEDATKIDLLSGKVAARFCKELFMMAIVVVDEDAQSVKLLLPDISSEYEVQSMASINKQIAMLSSASEKTRDIFKMLQA